MRLTPYLRLLRPHQWVKNGFVFLGLLFGHAWNDPAKVAMAGWAFAAFCLLASSVYAMNDILDREEDRRHPDKHRRPLASGEIGVGAAAALMAACAAGGLALAFGPAGSAPWIYLAYLGLNAGYSLGLKRVVVLDVFIIAAGFMLRILAGTLGIGILPSRWLLLCGLLLTLFLGFAKRYAELGALGEAGPGHRRVLARYSRSLLNQLITLAAAGTVVAYSYYTVSEETVLLHGTAQLIYTVPFVLYGMFRYLFLLRRRGGGGDPALDLLRDPQLLAATAGWLAATVWLLA
jgi:4-hydroxybenzoate polyprenyltransferase